MPNEFSNVWGEGKGGIDNGTRERKEVIENVCQ